MTTIEKATELSPAKRAQILAGALAAFIELGFERTSVDSIAARAGVSKATVYKHFHDKNALFVACFVEDARNVRRGLMPLLDTPTGDIARDLQQIGEASLRLLLAPSTIRRHRIIAAEASRFPELGAAVFEHGPRATHAQMALYLERASAAGALRIEDSAAAAIDFFALCHGDLYVKAQLGIIDHATEEQIRTTITRAVRTFVRAYSP